MPTPPTHNELSSDEDRPAAGQQFGHFQIISLLGAGGMGEVYLAHDARLGRNIALKLLPSSFTDDADRVRRFAQEARAASALNHPNILTIYEIGLVNGRHFIATEYVVGETLRRHMGHEGQLELATALDVATQVATALAAAHEAGVVHRDIKPENVMVRRDQIVKLLDFGLAKLTEQKDAKPADSQAPTLVMTTPGIVLGTVAYMSPEQARGQEVDARTDIFSLGAMLYEMLTGRLPFAGETTSDMLASILRSEAAPAANFNQAVPAELERVISKALRKDRAERYQTAKDLLVDLQQLKKQLEFTAELKRTTATDRHAHATTQIIEVEAHNSIAVLPFANLSAEAEQEYFCDGLAEELLNALTKIEELKVASRTSAFSFKGKKATVSEIGNALKVKTVLDGSVRKSGNRMRITIQLVNAADGYQLWSERYDRELQDIFDVQDEIALAVVAALQVKLLGQERAAVLKHYTDNAEAYLLYLKGQYYRWKTTPEEFGKSLNYFQQAVAAEPTFALGYFGLATYYGYGTAWGLLPLPPHEGWLKAEAAIAKALEVDETLPELQLSLAAFRLINHRDWAEAGRDIERAASANTKFPEIHYLYAFYLVAVGRFAEAIAETQLALKLDPLSLNYSRFLGICFHFARRYDEAVGQFHEALELEPNDPLTHEALAEAYERQEMYGKAVAAWQRAKMLAGDNESAVTLGSIDDKVGFNAVVRAAARKRLAQLVERSARGAYVPAIYYARSYVQLGDQEQAFAWLEKACDERNVFPLLINSDPFYDSLRADPRFAACLQRIGLQPADQARDQATNQISGAQTVSPAPGPTAANEISTTANEIAVQSKPPQQRRQARRTWLLLASLSLLVALAGFFAYRSFTADTRQQIESIAVLPFANESGNSEVEYLSDGMTESLINSLSQLPKLSVKARSSVFRYKGKELEPQQIAAALSVQAILSGRFVQRGDELALYLSLIDARNGNQLWGEEYHRKLGDLVTLQSKIAQDVAQKLRARLSGADEQKLAKNYTENAEAYQLYLKGRYYWYKFPAQEFEKSGVYYQQAIDVDPNYALAYAGLAEYYGFGAANGFLPPTNENGLKTEAAARKALTLDDTLPDAYNALAGVKQFSNDRAGAERDLKRAIELNPNYAEGRAHYAMYLILDVGRSEEATAQMKKVLELEPLSVSYNRILGMMFYWAHQYDHAIEQYQKTLELDQNDAFTHELLGDAYEQKGRQKEAVAEWSRALTLTGDNDAATMFERTYAASDFNAAIRALWQRKLERFNEKTKRGEYVPAMNYALAYTRLADKEQALAWLAKAEQERNALRLKAKFDPIYNSLRDDPRFQDLLRRVGG